MSENVLSVDPALHGCGLALWRDGKLVRAGYASSDGDTKDDVVRRAALSARAAVEWLGLGSCLTIDCLVFELPQIYSRGANKTKGDPNKCVLPLAMVDAAIASLFPKAQIKSVQPHAWKGGTRKPERVTDQEYVITTRVKVRFNDSPEELAAVDWTKSVERSWDVADAIGVGLHHLGRFERKRVFPRE